MSRILTALALVACLVSCAHAEPAPQAQQPKPPPGRPTTFAVDPPSPNCTRITTGGTLWAADSALWTIEAGTQRLLRNGGDSQGKGTVLLVSGGQLYTLGTDTRWWVYKGNAGWSSTGAGDPCASLPKPIEPIKPVDPVVPPKPVTPTPPTSNLSTLTWDQRASSLAAARALTYRLYLDTSTISVPATGVVCSDAVAGTPAGAFPCSASFPATTPGPHTVRITATDATGESLPSNALGFDLRAVPQAPTEVRAK